MKLVFATANPDKVIEIQSILPEFEIIPRPNDIPSIEESGNTYLENARIKAQTIMQATGFVSIADDSGIELEALNGEPGVDSAYFAGPNASYEENTNKVLRDLQDKANRNATFRCVAYAAFPNDDDLIAEGSNHGSIADAPRGENGFGYDPIFIPNEGDGRTFGEMTKEEKFAISHRGRAFHELGRLLRERGL
jgi:XTP/dITP diphosphohydrolase